MDKKTILFLNNTVKECGCYQVGKKTYGLLHPTEDYDIWYKEVNSEVAFRESADALQPDLLLFNFHPIIMPWLHLGLLNEYRHMRPTAFIHEYLGVPNTQMFKYCFYSDTGAKEDYKDYPNVFVTGRPLYRYQGLYPINAVPTIGSYGFGLPIKRFDYLVQRVNEEFDEAVINIQMPSAFYGDDGHNGVLNAVIESCRVKNIKPGVQLNITTDFMDINDSLAFLAGNDINAFLYAELPNKGVASSLDMALSVHRPVAVTRTYMFRHMKDIWDKISIEDNSFTDIVTYGTDILFPYYEKWKQENYAKEFEDGFKLILEDVQ
jgi:hypothetical protein